MILSYVLGIDESIGNSPIRKMSLNGKWKIFFFYQILLQLLTKYYYGGFLNSIVIVSKWIIKLKIKTFMYTNLYFLTMEYSC